MLLNIYLVWGNFVSITKLLGNAPSTFTPNFSCPFCILNAWWIRLLSFPFHSILTASTSYSDHQKKALLSPVSFTPIHYGPINLPKGQSSENFQCLSPREFRPTFLGHSLQFGFHQNFPAVSIYPFIYLLLALAKLAYLLSLKQIFHSCTFVQFPFFFPRKAIPQGPLTG